MDEQGVTLYAFTLAMCEWLMADVSQAEMERQPTAGVNPPAWILGHLAICTDYALQIMGRPMRLLKTWHEEFGPETSPLPTTHAYPSRDELLDALRGGHEEVVAALATVDAAKLSAPNPLSGMPFLQQT